MQLKAGVPGIFFQPNRFRIASLIVSREAVEDLTGGVTTDFLTSDLLDRDRFWTDEFSLANKDFLFAAAVSGREIRSGIQAGHSYSILKVEEVKGERFVLVRYVPTDIFLFEGGILKEFLGIHGDTRNGQDLGVTDRKSGLPNG